MWGHGYASAKDQSRQRSWQASAVPCQPSNVALGNIPFLLLCCAFVYLHVGEGEGKEGQRERGGNVYFKKHFLIKQQQCWHLCGVGVKSEPHGVRLYSEELAAEV